MPTAVESQTHHVLCALLKQEQQDQNEQNEQNEQQGQQEQLEQNEQQEQQEKQQQQQQQQQQPARARERREPANQFSTLLRPSRFRVRVQHPQGSLGMTQPIRYREMPVGPEMENHRVADGFPSSDDSLLLLRGTQVLTTMACLLRCP